MGLSDFFLNTTKISKKNSSWALTYTDLASKITNSSLALGYNSHKNERLGKFEKLLTKQSNLKERILAEDIPIFAFQELVIYQLFERGCDRGAALRL